jgi:ABC-type uncharacterized transport system substrate-binding protein
MRLLALALACVPAVATAHPHEFVEAALTFRMTPEGRITAIEVAWHYDAFTSMLILSDLGIDPSATDLAPEAVPELQGFDTDWIEGYNGDLWAEQGGLPVTLGSPIPGPVEVAQGQVVSRHVRPLPEPVDPRAALLRVRVYDPEFYIAYTVAVPPAVEGAPGCRARVFGPDLEAAHSTLEAALAEVAGGDDMELNFPAVGEHFADEVVIDCD